mmetsp:Transcript_58754/g.97051  ORF Transcript_58754/g.97051 Transcript_58754/m.97051 type:complete len:1917 (+) Transcript_58754:53-5803(+)
METRAQSASEAGSSSCGSRTRSKRPFHERTTPLSLKRGRTSVSNNKRTLRSMSERADSSLAPRASKSAVAQASSCPAVATTSSSGNTQPEQRRQHIDEEDASEMEGNEARASGQSWGGPSSALQGLLRKLGAGLDDFLPAVANSNSRLKTILAGLKAEDDGLQLASLSELCELLSIGTEESMSALSVDVFVPLLVQLLRREHNADIMLLASRALCHMVDAIPSSSAAIVHYDGVPLFCERLLSIEYIDLAEQALQALEKLSHEHALCILRAGGMLAVLQYVDFFAMGVQRLAVSTAANLCRGLPVECAHLVTDAVPLLSGLLNHQDQKVLENVCLGFSRLVEDFARSPQQLDMLAAYSLLPNLLRLVSGMISGSNSLGGESRVTLSDATYTMLLRTLATLCRGSPALCKQLLELDVSSTLHAILVVSNDGSGQGIGASISRPHDQLFQLFSLANELLPPVPSPGSDRVSTGGGSSPPASNCSGGGGASSSGGRSLVPKRRSKRHDPDVADKAGSAKEGTGIVQSEREMALSDSPELLQKYAEKLFPLLLLVHSSAINASVRHKCLSCMTKVLYLYPTPRLTELLRELPLAAFLAPLISSQEQSTALSALHMAEILLTKLPHIYEEKFLREGVFHAVTALCAKDEEDASSAVTAATSSSVHVLTRSSAASSAPAPTLSQPLRRTSRRQADQAKLSILPSSLPPAAASPSMSAVAGTLPSTSLATDTRRNGKLRRGTGCGRYSADEGDTTPAAIAGEHSPVPLRNAHCTVDSAVASRAARFEELFVRGNLALASTVSTGEGSATLKKLRSLASNLTNSTLYSTLNPEVPLAGCLDSFADVHALRQLAELLQVHEGVSTFELANSGLIDALLRYLAPQGVGSDELEERRPVRLRAFCHVFLGLPPPALQAAVHTQGKSVPPPPTQSAPAMIAKRPIELPLLQHVVLKLQDALNMVERFPLVLADSTGNESSSSGLKVLTQPFKLRLQRSPGVSGSLKEYASNLVLIEPLATAAAIEEFLWPKVRRDNALRQALRDAGQRPPEAPPGEGVSAAPAGEREASSSACGGAIGRGGLGKQPVRNCDSGNAAVSTKARSTNEADFPSRACQSTAETAKQREVGVFLSGFEENGDGELEEDVEDGGECDNGDVDEEGDEGDEGDEGSVLSSPALASSVESTECVHDLQLNSPEQRSCSSAPGKSPPPFQLPSPSAAASQASRKGSTSTSSAHGSSRAVPSSSADAAAPVAARALETAAAPGAATSSDSAAESDCRRHNLILLLNDQPLPYSMTIFQAVRQFGLSAGHNVTSTGLPAHQLGIGQRLWNDVYTITYRLATSDDQATQEAQHEGPVGEELGSHGGACVQPVRVGAHDADPLQTHLSTELPAVLPRSDPASTVLQLLWLLRSLSEHWHCLFDPLEMPESASLGVSVLPSSSFLNLKLNAKLMRQLQDPLALCTRSLPQWCAALTSSCAFLFTFESRRLFLQSTAFGLSRALQRLQQHSNEGSGSSATNSDRSELRLGRLPRQKVRISRSRVMDSAFKVMEMYASHKALLEVEYFGEVGTGLGPTLEFYSLVSLDLRRVELQLWLHEDPPRDGAEMEGGTYIYAPQGLFPKPMLQPAEGTEPSRTLQIFTFMGRFVAKAMLDNRLVDLPFSTTFYRHLLGCELGMNDLYELNPQLAKSLTQLQQLAVEHSNLLRCGGEPAEIEAAVQALSLQGCPVADLGLDWTLPGHPQVELVPGGAQRNVTIENLSEYVQLVMQTMLLDGVRAQMNAFTNGFSEVLSCHYLQAFSPEELDLLFNGTREAWDRDVVVEQLKFDHGYTRASRAVGFLLDILSKFDDLQLRQFLKFVTGSPRLPVGGLGRLTPRLTIVQKRPENGVSPDAYLPSVMTCANYLKLPDYTSKEVMRERLLTAINEGQGCFLLS